MVSLTLKTEDITCTGCALDVENILRDTEGVLGASVDFQEGAIKIDYDPEVLDERKITLIVRRLGLRVRRLGPGV